MPVFPSDVYTLFNWSVTYFDNDDTQTAITKSLETTQGTISKEIERNKGCRSYA